MIIAGAAHPIRPGGLILDGVRVMPLRNFSPDQTRALLEIEGMSTDSLDPVMTLTHGYPLAASLLIDALRRSGSGIDVPESMQDLLA